MSCFLFQIFIFSLLPHSSSVVHQSTNIWRCCKLGKGWQWLTIFGVFRSHSFSYLGLNKCCWLMEALYDPNLTTIIIHELGHPMRNHCYVFHGVSLQLQPHRCYIDGMNWNDRSSTSKHTHIPGVTLIVPTFSRKAPSYSQGYLHNIPSGKIMGECPE